MTFDAFYAASVHRVTSQVHAQSQDDPLSDHAIREAYARAYQQWYEVSTYPDPEAWDLPPAGCRGHHGSRSDHRPSSPRQHATLAARGRCSLCRTAGFVRARFRRRATGGTTTTRGHCSGPRRRPGMGWRTGRRPGFGAQAPLRRGKSSRGFVVAIVAVVVIAIATVGYVAFGRGLSRNSAGQNPGTGVN